LLGILLKLGDLKLSEISVTLSRRLKPKTCLNALASNALALVKYNEKIIENSV